MRSVALTSTLVVCLLCCCSECVLKYLDMETEQVYCSTYMKFSVNTRDFWLICCHDFSSVRTSFDSSLIHCLVYFAFYEIIIAAFYFSNSCLFVQTHKVDYCQVVLELIINFIKQVLQFPYFFTRRLTMMGPYIDVVTSVLFVVKSTHDNAN